MTAAPESGLSEAATRADFATAAAGIGAELRSEEFRTSSHRIAQFAAALGDANPAHLAGRIAPPTFAHIPIMQSMVQVLQQVTDAFLLHGEHDFVFHRPIEPGQRLFSRSRLVGLRGGKAGLLLIVRSDTETHRGEPVVTQFTTCLQRGAAEERTAGEAPPLRPPAAGELTPAERYPISPGLTQGYAEAARDYSPYCLSPEVARGLGFAAPLVHGMLSLSLATRGLVQRAAGGDAARLRRLGCRFSRPLLSRDGESLQVFRTGSRIVHFTAQNGDGAPVLTRGYAEVAA
ncbi:MAG: MaoC/PaaZ C-terminal domain-containing protein [Rhodospirillales bacterium]